MPSRAAPVLCSTQQPASMQLSSRLIYTTDVRTFIYMRYYMVLSSSCYCVVSEQTAYPLFPMNISFSNVFQMEE